MVKLPLKGMMFHILSIFLKYVLVKLVFRHVVGHCLSQGY